LEESNEREYSTNDPDYGSGSVVFYDPIMPDDEDEEDEEAILEREFGKADKSNKVPPFPVKSMLA